MTAGSVSGLESANRVVHREIVLLLLLLALTVAGFFVTRRFAATNHAMRLEDARTWYARGEQALQKGDAEAALAALRQATAKNPELPAYRLALANALILGHQDDNARQVLLDLREQQPEDPETNLQLARLEQRRGDPGAISRYYQTALTGLWTSDQRPAQRRVRTEFIQFLLNQGERDHALSELLVLEPSLPNDRSSQLEAGRMLLAAGDARRAGDHFGAALRVDPKDPVALAGAGESWFELGDYARARRYFADLDTKTPRTGELLAVTDFVLNSDPLAPRLPMAERRIRLAAGIAQLARHLDACLALPAGERREADIDLQPLVTDVGGLEASLSGRTAPKTFEDIENGFDRVHRIARAASSACGSPDPFDRALLLIGRRHGLEDQ